MGSKSLNLLTFILSITVFSHLLSPESASASATPVDTGTIAGGHSDNEGNTFDSVGNLLSTDFGQQLTDFGIKAGMEQLGLGGGKGNEGPAATGKGGVNDYKIRCAAQKLLSMTEGNLGALIMVVAGIGTIIASAFGAFRAATSLLAVAVGAFVLRSFVEIFFDADLNLGGECNLSAVNTERGGNGN